MSHRCDVDRLFSTGGMQPDCEPLAVPARSFSQDTFCRDVHVVQAGSSFSLAADDDHSEEGHGGELLDHCLVCCL